MSGIDFPDFSAFFAAVNRGRAPFPWQRNLAERVVERGWPGSIGIPTGMGKTACIDVAVWALALDAVRRGARREAATRIWYVVNRRLLIDAALERAEWLARALANPEVVAEGRSGETSSAVEAVRAVADALRAIGAGIAQRPLHVARLRGGAELGQRPPEPAQPALILATVPMFASRLLFRGYGSSTSTRPIDAALAGVDSLVLLDEAHLAAPLRRLVTLAADCDLGDAKGLLPGPRAACRLVGLTATGDADADRFELGDDDRQDPTIRRRLTATKPTLLRTTSTKQLADDLAAGARELVSARPGSACVVFCNTVATARRVRAALGRAEASGVDVLLLTGQMREREADQVRRRLVDPTVGVPAGRDPSVPLPRSLIVVATQTLEVGADVDFDFLVGEMAGARAVVQRLGRLNRLGDRPHAQAILYFATDAKPGRVYGEEPAVVWNRLEEARRRRSGAGPLDLMPAVVAEVVGKPGEESGRAGELLPDHLWELAKTSLPEPDEPPVELFFDEIDVDGDVSVSWRALLPPDGARLVPSVREAEAVDLPLREVTAALKGLSIVRRLADDRASLEPVDVDALRPGDHVVLDASDGRYDRDGWNPDSRERVLDVSPLQAGTLWLRSDALGNLLREEVPPDVADLLRQLDPDDEDTPDAATERGLVEALLDRLAEIEPHPWIERSEWVAYLDRLRAAPVVRDRSDLPPRLLAARPARGRVELRADAFEELSFDATSTQLDDHHGSVAELAGWIGRRLGLPAEVVATVEWAGRHHDVGKRDRRFQRWLDPDGGSSAPLAKSGVGRDAIERWRHAAGWPRGGRHELLSVRLLEEYAAANDLVGVDPELGLHLVASHHGHGRPWIRVVGDEAPTVVTAEVDGQPVEVDGDLSSAAWEQPGRFRRLCERYGVWGLALIEAVLRQADHLASGAVEVA